MHIIRCVWPLPVDLAQADVAIVSPLVAIGTERSAQLSTHGSLPVLVDIHTEHLDGIQAHGSALVEIGVEQIVAQDLKAFCMVDCYDVVCLLVRPLAVRHRFEPLATMWADDFPFVIAFNLLD